MSLGRTWCGWLGVTLGGISSFVLATNSYADEQDRVLESPRALGRGDTYVAAYDSDEGSRANPATLAEAKVNFQVRWLQLDLLIGKNSIDSIKQLNDFSGQDSAVTLLDKFTDKFGKRQYARIQAVPLALRFGSFEISPFVSTSNFVDMRSPTEPEILFRSDSVAGVNLTYSMQLTKEIAAGLTIRPTRRTLFEGEVQFSDLLDFVDNDNFKLDDLFEKREGVQIGADLGFVWTPTKNWRFGLLGENLGYAGAYGQTDKPPPPVPQRISTGMNYRYDMKPWNWDFALDLQDMVNPEHRDWLRLIHMGTELGRSYFSRDNDAGLLFGVNEGYLTTGAYVDFFLARLNVSYYAVELGEYAGQRPDRRWGVTLVSSTTF